MTTPPGPLGDAVNQKADTRTALIARTITHFSGNGIALGDRLVPGGVDPPTSDAPGRALPYRRRPTRSLQPFRIWQTA